MTLDTRVYVLDRIDYRETFTKCAQLLGVTEHHRIEDRQDGTWNAGDRTVESGNPWTIMTAPGQGLPAWLMLHYRPDAPYRTEEQAAEHRPACWLEISFDTAYGYQDEQGRGCGDPHASVVAQLGQWLDERGVRWLWLNEFTGEIHSGYDRLVELCTDGFAASAWFQTTVLPAIQGGAL